MTFRIRQTNDDIQTVLALFATATLKREWPMPFSNDDRNHRMTDDSLGSTKKRRNMLEDHGQTKMDDKQKKTVCVPV